MKPEIGCKDVYETARKIVPALTEYWICSKDEAPLQCFKSQFEVEHAFKAIIKEHPEEDFGLLSVYFDKDNVCIGMPLEAEYKNGKEWWPDKEETEALAERKCIDRGWDDIPD